MVYIPFGEWKPDESTIGADSLKQAYQVYANGLTYSPLRKMIPASEAMEGTARDFTEAMLKDVVQKCYEAGGNPNMIMVAPSKKGFISDTFGGTGDKVTTFRSQDSVTTGNVVEIYQSDFGLLDVVPNRVMKSATAALNNEDKVYVIDPEFWAMASLRDLQYVDLAKTGDSDKFQLVAEMTLEARNEASSGAVFDLK